MASIGGTITHSPNTSGSDICWVLFHSSDINPIHQLFCQLPLSGLRGDCSFGGLWVLVYLGSSSAPHEVWLDFFFPLVFLVLPVSLRVCSIFPEQIWLWLLAFSGLSTGPKLRPTLTLLMGGLWLVLTAAPQPLRHLLDSNLLTSRLLTPFPRD